MMGRWLNRNNPVLDRITKVEPGATFSLLENHWKQAMDVMEGPMDSPSEAALIVISHLNQMITFLRVAQTEDPEQNCKKFWVLNRCSDIVIKWLHTLQIQGLQLLYEDERKLVQTLQSLCELAAKDGELLGYITKETPSSSSSSSWDGACSLSSLLLEYSLKSDPYLGEPARNSFIHLIQLASKYPPLQETFCHETGLGLTNVIISGLSACFAQLPTFTPGTLEQLEPFVTQLQFVDAVAHAAPSRVSSAIADCFTNAFLQAVILPALTQDEGNRSLHRQDDHFVTSLHEEIAVVTSYMKIVCSHLTHPLLIRSLLVFLTSTSNLLKVFVHRMNHPNIAVTVATLDLLSTLLSFYCEDLWHTLILQYLMPQNHLIVSQRLRPAPDIDYGEASVRFISLIPVQVLDTLGPDAIAFHYTQYLSNEQGRWSSFDEMTLLPPPLISASPDAIQNSTNNPTFPCWKYRYDGTDSIAKQQEEVSEEEASSKVEEVSPKEPQPTETDPLTLTLNSESAKDESSVQPKFTTIPLQPSLSLDEQMSSLGIISEEHSLTNVDEQQLSRNFSDGYGSLESNGDSSSASFGPFLDTLLLHLSNLHQLPPDVILMATDLLSILASSRIPLLSSILLDPNIILQPSFTPFNLLLNRTRVEMENALRGHGAILNEVWTAMCKRNGNLYNQSRSPRDSLVSSLSNTFDATTDNLMRKISASSSFSSMFNSVLQRRTTTGVPEGSGGSGNHSPNPSIPHSDSVQSVGNSPGYRYAQNKNTNSQPAESSPKPQRSVEAIRAMATRAIFFSHWLLELGAIAQQLCWKRPSL